jgi:NTE family protein
MRTGLVLGAGGMVGRAFHLALLTALREELGWEADRADVVVGTSAGSLLGACIRAGVSIDDLVREATDGDLGSACDALAAIGPAPRPPAPTFEFGSPPVSLRHLTARARDDTPLRWTTAVCCLIPRGRCSTDEHAAWVDRLIGARWPARPLWVCAVEMPSMQRVVWGRSPQQDPAIGDAVAASCAIPGYLAPRVHLGREFVDGGIHSPTNADVLVGHGLDRVIISSPMSAVDGYGATPADRVARRFRRRLLHDEASALRRDGTRVVIVEPTADDLEVMRSHRIHEPLPDGLIDRLHASIRTRLREGEFDGWHAGPRYGSTAVGRRDDAPAGRPGARSPN